MASAPQMCFVLLLTSKCAMVLLWVALKPKFFSNGNEMYRTSYMWVHIFTLTLKSLACNL